MLIILKLLTLDNNSVALLSVHILFIRLNGLPHSAMLEGMVCMHHGSGFRVSGSLSGSSIKSLKPVIAWSSQRLNHLHCHLVLMASWSCPEYLDHKEFKLQIRSSSELLIRLCRNCFGLIDVSFTFDSREIDPKCPEARDFDASSYFSLYLSSFGFLQ